MDHERIERLTNQREEEWREILAYVETNDCLMQFLGHALDDNTVGPCENCASCLGQPLISEEIDPDLINAASRFLRQSEILIKPRVLIPRGALRQYDFGNPLSPELRAETGRVLARWNDAGWGRAVADDKHAGSFRDELVEAVAEMITERWLPDPYPQWVTCVPSNRHPELVPSFASRLAAKLDLPFHGLLNKCRNNRPQKEQENQFHQCRNLDGVFEVSDQPPPGPVFLIDDMVDSRWTLTVCAALLRQNGSGPVYPVALASTGSL
jgi:ATP-dependent DNA helicase RecQ